MHKSRNAKARDKKGFYFLTMSKLKTLKVTTSCQILNGLYHETWVPEVFLEENIVTYF